MARCFTRYLQTVELAADADVAVLMAAARKLRGPFEAATFETLTGLLAATGLRGDRGGRH